MRWKQDGGRVCIRLCRWLGRQPSQSEEEENASSKRAVIGCSFAGCTNPTQCIRRPSGPRVFSWFPVALHEGDIGECTSVTVTGITNCTAAGRIGRLINPKKPQSDVSPCISLTRTSSCLATRGKRPSPPPQPDVYGNAQPSKRQKEGKLEMIHQRHTMP